MLTITDDYACIGEGNGNTLQYSYLENPGTEEPDGLPSMELHRRGHDWSDLAAAAAAAWYEILYMWNTMFFLALTSTKTNGKAVKSSKFLDAQIARI